MYYGSGFRPRRHGDNLRPEFDQVYRPSHDVRVKGLVCFVELRNLKPGRGLRPKTSSIAKHRVTFVLRANFEVFAAAAPTAQTGVWKVCVKSFQINIVIRKPCDRFE